MTETITLAGRVREVLLGAGFDDIRGIIVPGGTAFQATEGAGVTVSVHGTATHRTRRGLLYRYMRALRDAGMTVSDRTERGYVFVHEEGQEADPVEVKDRVNAVLACHFEDAAFLAAGVTGGTAAIVTTDGDWERLAQYAATLRESGFIVADHSERGQLYVREHGPAHGLAMAREIAGICRSGYSEHVRAHGPDGGAVGDLASAAQGGRFTVEREGCQYDLIVVPRAGQS
jgi:hypothetical protein